MKKKKNKIQKRRNQIRQKKQRSAKMNVIRNKPQPHPIFGQPISDINVPDGFRAVSPSQGMVEYAHPILELAEAKNIKDPNEVFQLAMLIWNYAISLEGKIDSPKSEKDIIQLLQKTLQYNPQQATEFFNMMVERHQYLFPEELQPVPLTALIMRKEEHFLVNEFNYDSLKLSSE
ncbi:hypothetical protein JW964_15320, partial [candidate division KSB1 bacterium]|nr:hypothetical protein [candidate division KSB1 bacterium]